MAKTPGLITNIDDVRAMNETIDNSLNQPRIRKDLDPLTKRQINNNDQATALVALGKHLENGLNNAIKQNEIAELIQNNKLGSGITTNNAHKLTPNLNLLEFVNKANKHGEANTTTLLTGTENQANSKHRLTNTQVTDEDHTLTIIDPGTLNKRNNRDLRNVRIISKNEVVQTLDNQKAHIDQPSLLTTLNAFLVFGLKQHGEIDNRHLLLARSLLDECTKATTNNRKLELDHVHINQHLQHHGLRVLDYGHHQSHSSAS